MKCNYCGNSIDGSHSQVTVIIDDDLVQNYCGSPLATNEDGLSCWQHAIEAWHRLIRFEQAMPSTQLESLLPVKRFVRP